MLALLFPGQGSQRPQMGLPWADHPSFEVVKAISEASGRDVEALLCQADAETLKATRNAQLATFALSAVIFKAACQAGLDLGRLGGEVALAGHSLGEYSALAAGGAIALEAAAHLVSERGEAMEAAAQARAGTMAAVLGLEPEAVAQACEAAGEAWPANDNAPGQVVIAGTVEAVEVASAEARRLGAKRVLPLAVGGAFHSPLMAPAQPRLDRALAEAPFVEPAWPVYANVDAKAHRSDWPKLLSAQLVSPVRWRETLLNLAGEGATHFLELGAGSELSGMVKRTLDASARASVSTPEDLGRLEAFLSPLFGERS